MSTHVGARCDVDVDSIEVFFDATGDDLVVFVDELLAFEASQEHHGRAFVGYASLRFTGPTGALLGPQRWDCTCAIEVACLRDVDGGQQLNDYAAKLALKPDFRGILHWGQRNDAEASHIAHAFGPQAIDSWRQMLRDLTLPYTNFSNAFSRRTGLEP